MSETNKLNKENSLYLRQHADNPVFWYPWCDEAFHDAKKIQQTNNALYRILSVSLVPCNGA
jgi:uncharacterized protein YyaL (SSP411 family)